MVPEEAVYGGTGLLQNTLGNLSFVYIITVFKVPEGFSGHGENARLSPGAGLERNIAYNVYGPECGGSGSQHGDDDPLFFQQDKA